MALSVETLFGGKFTLQAKVSTQASADTGIVFVPAEVEDHWVRRLGFTPGEPNSAVTEALIRAGILDQLYYVKAATAGGYDVSIWNVVDYNPANPAGGRLRFTIETFGTGSGGAIIWFYASLTHTLKR